MTSGLPHHVNLRKGNVLDPKKNPPNQRNGWYDDGSPLRHGRKQCPRCQSTRYIESLSREQCHACGLECDYWSIGVNFVYQDMLDRLVNHDEAHHPGLPASA